MPERREENQKPARRPIWSGAISIGLVNVPVKLFTMTRDNSFSFRMLHKEDGQPLRYDRVCVKDDKVVPWEDTVKGYEVRRGEYVVVSQKEIDAVKPESDRRIRLEKFVDYLSVEPVYFETPYVMAPDKNPEAYSLLLTAFHKIGKAGVGRITLRTKEYPVLVHAFHGALLLTTLRYADEVMDPRGFDGIGSLKEPTKAEVDMAIKIIEGFSGDFEISDFKDTYRERLQKLIEGKIAGEKIVTVVEPKREEAKELMQALQETLAQLGKK